MFVLKISVFSHKMSECFIVLNGWIKRFLAAEILGRLKKKCYLLVVEWTNRSLSDIGKMNEPGQQGTLLTPDDLQRFSILISIFRTIKVQSMTKINCFFLDNQMNWNHFQIFESWKTDVTNCKTADSNAVCNDYFFMATCYQVTKGDWCFYGYPKTLVIHSINKTASILIVRKCAWPESL